MARPSHAPHGGHFVFVIVFVLSIGGFRVLGQKRPTDCHVNLHYKFNCVGVSIGDAYPQMKDYSDEEDIQVEEEPLTDKRQKRTSSCAPALTAKRAVRPPLPDLTWIPGHYETTEGAGPAISERAWRGRYEEAEDVDDRHSRRKRKADYDLVSRQRATAGVKPNRVFVLPGGEVDATCEGKNAWDEALRDLIPKCLDMSVVAWSKHDPQ